MTQVIDRRDSSKGTASRQRFIERNRQYAKDAVDRALEKGGVTDIGKGGVDVPVPRRDISEPTIHHGSGGVNRRVLPGNKEFRAGDRIPRPDGGGGGGGGKEAGEGESEDDFSFHLSEEEFLQILFDDLELPNMIKKSEDDNNQMQMHRAGHVSSGPYNKLDLIRSKKQRAGRLIAAESKHYKKIIELLEEKKSILEYYDCSADRRYGPGLTSLFDGEWTSKKRRIQELESKIEHLDNCFGALLLTEEAARMKAIDEEILGHKRQIKGIARWDESTDLRFRYHEPRPKPGSKAVMFCIMDVSGSMDEEMKSKAKLFYWLLYRFLTRHYEKVAIEFVRHTETAELVDEQEFFYGRKSGGTKVAAGLELTRDTIRSKYAAEGWNVYGAQASDGDCFGSDGEHSRKIMQEDLLPMVQAYFYTEIKDSGSRRRSDLWNAYEALLAANKGKFFMGEVNERRDIWPLFREFFQKRDEVQPGGMSPMAAFGPS